MCTLIDSDDNRIITIIHENIDLLKMFDQVYMFGSALDSSKSPNDVDLLLVYYEYLDIMKDEIKRIHRVLEHLIGVPVDLTVLSVAEERETSFLNRISWRCLRLK